MTISVRDRKLLWGRSGNRCAFTDCRRLLTIEAEETGRDAVVSHEAHIVAEEEDGPRGISPLSRAERDAYPNRILLCLEHHKIVDDDPDHWTVDRLLEMKATHEAWIQDVTSPDDQERLATELIYADIVQRTEREADLDDWQNWTSTLLYPRPFIRSDDLERIERLRKWLFTRPWPGTLPDLQRAFENFERILHDLAMVCQLGFEEDEWAHGLMLTPEYKVREVSQARYDKLLEQNKWTTRLIYDLVLELTRAANLLCDRIRRRLDPLFRVEEGVLMVEPGAGALYTSWARPTYQAEEMDSLYPGLEPFLDARVGRDIHYGEGRHDGGLAAITPFTT
jgi:hypothetical protein